MFLRDKTGIHFNLQDAAVTQCCGLLQLIIQEQNLPEEASNVFCLWLISPILGMYVILYTWGVEVKQVKKRYASLGQLDTG